MRPLGRREGFRGSRHRQVVHTQKGYGFIHPDGGGGDVFVHISAVERSGLSQLHEGQKVSCEVETGVEG